ncbi:zinc ribbon domain-containing protein [candidate division WOR-3 bacterium]|nr:zinc ribbon domain-containing protein [candidate division WOR-3 bacterium]
MPVYSYKCKECNEEFDLLIGVGKGNKELKCPKCGSQKLERLLSSFGVRMGGLSTGSSSCPTCSTGTCSLPPNEN